MNRRSLLALIGFAPVVGVAAALPRGENPVNLANLHPPVKRDIRDTLNDMGADGNYVTVEVLVNDPAMQRAFDDLMDKRMRGFERHIMNMQRKSRRHGLL